MAHLFQISYDIKHWIADIDLRLFLHPFVPVFLDMKYEWWNSVWQIQHVLCLIIYKSFFLIINLCTKMFFLITFWKLQHLAKEWSQFRFMTLKVSWHMIFRQHRSMLFQMLLFGNRFKLNRISVYKRSIVVKKMI